MSSAGYMKKVNYAAVILRESMTGYSAVKDRLALRLMGVQGNEQALESLPYMKREDMAVTVYCILPDDSALDITRSELERWGIDRKTLFSDALRGSIKLLPPVFRSMNDMIGVRDAAEADSMYVLTNTHMQLGAATVLYPNLLEALTESVGDHYYLLPSSVHEMIVLPDSGEDPHELRKIVTEVNRTELEPEDVLTDSVYYFDAGNPTFYRVC